MATVTARILQSQGLEAAVGSLATREVGLTSDTERPVVGTTVGGPKFIGTEGLTLITTVAPSALTTLRRSRSIIYIDTATAGGDVALDIQAGAQSAGYKAEVVCVGPAGRKAVVTYGSGQVIAVPVNTSQELEWSGTAWNLPIPSDALIEKKIRERGKYVGELFAHEELKLPAGWTPSTPETYYPELCLTNFLTYLDISAANWPDLVPYLRTLKVKFKNGLAGEISSPSVTNWAVATNVATLTFANTADQIAMLAALLEDEVAHGGYSNWRSVTLAGSIGNIPAGEYAITNVNASSRTIAFAVTAADGSAAGSWTVDFYAHRIPGSTTTARVYSARGQALHGANDDNGYFVAGGLRRRGFFQGHRHLASGQATNTNQGVQGFIGTAKIDTTSTERVLDPITDGTNGTPRTAKETNSPATVVHIYQHGGRYLP